MASVIDLATHLTVRSMATKIPLHDVSAARSQIDAPSPCFGFSTIRDALPRTPEAPPARSGEPRRTRRSRPEFVCRERPTPSRWSRPASARVRWSESEAARSVLRRDRERSLPQCLARQGSRTEPARLLRPHIVDVVRESRCADLFELFV